MARGGYGHANDATIECDRGSRGRSYNTRTNTLLLLVPVSVVLAYRHAPPLWIFAAGTAAIIPLAQWIRRATEQIANRAGASIGGLNSIALDGETTWFEGVMLIAVYVLLAMVFLFAAPR